MASFEHDKLSTCFSSPDRPPFTQTKTSDRLRECERRPSISNMSNKKPRRSVFREEGLEDLDHSVHYSENTRREIPSVQEEDMRERNVTFDGILKSQEHKDGVEHAESTGKRNSPWYSKISKGRPKVTTAASAPPGQFSTIPRVALIVFLISVVVPGFRYSAGKDKVNISGADAGVIMRAELVDNGSMIEGRENSPTDTCTRWSHMSMSLYGFSREKH